MLRKTFETEIKQVKDDVLMLGSMVEHIHYWLGGSVEEARSESRPADFGGDRAINKKRFAN